MRNIEDIYTLSPVQQGVLCHTLAHSDGGAYVERVSWSLHGQLNVSAFHVAWEEMVQHHTILSTSFVYENVVEPLQIVRRRVTVPWVQYDWRALSESEQQSRLRCLLEAERRGFDLSDAPLIRLTLIRLAPEAYHFIWSYHHLLLDGWSVSLILKEVQDRYAALLQEKQLLIAETRPYREYIAWLQQQDINEAENYWRQKLTGFIYSALNGFSGNNCGGNKSYSEQQSYLSAEATFNLRAKAREHQWTVSTLIEAAWGLVLSHYGGKKDLVFGSRVSGRPMELPGSETMVGLFMNTLPLRIQVKPEERVCDWLTQLQAQQVERHRYQYNPLTLVLQWSEATPGQPLFESVIVFENMPVEDSLQLPTIDVRHLMHHEIAKDYPLTVAVVPGLQFRLQISYDNGRFERATIARMVCHLQKILASLAADTEQCVATLLMLTRQDSQTHVAP